MLLKFKTHFPWNDEHGNPVPTHFVPQIANALQGIVGPPGAKHHTLRRINGKPRFREGMKLQMATGPRFKPDIFRETECTRWKHLKMDIVYTQVAGYQLRVRVCHPGVIPYKMPPDKLHWLAMWDGFPDLESFTRWFLADLLTNGPGDFELVGWTDVRY